jgi:UDP-glucose 4-epimerase
MLISTQWSTSRVNAYSLTIDAEEEMEVTQSTAAAGSGLVLLTGSEGRVGRHLGTALPEHGYQVRSLDIRAATSPDRDHLVVDLLDQVAVREATVGVDAVVHAGAIPGDHRGGDAVMAANVLGTWNVLQAAVDAGVQRMVCFSSVNAQGSVGGHRPTEYLPIDDDYPHHPMTPYQLSKHLVEEMCRSFAERYGIATLCLRPVWVTRQEDYQDAGFGTGAFLDRWRDDFWAYVDIRDVGDAVERCLELQGVRHDRFLLAAADTSAHVETRRLVARELAGVPWPSVDPDEYLSTSPYRSLIDCSHAQVVLGWQARHSWRDTRADGS